MKQWLMQIRLARPEMLQTGPTPEEQELVGRHFAYWSDLAAQGVALVVGRTQVTENPIGLAIFQASSEEVAKKIVDGDPAVGKVFISELAPYYVALLGDPEPFRPTD
ncbi:MAG: hypothetical protein JSS72_09615 [Armatimonadetes bacterium]|nr:hypothetical protein [Armatimonadota bacterium]